jgi:hypothetical protein
LAGVKTRLDQRVEDRRYRFALVRGCKLVADWCHNAEPGDRLEIASTWKSMLSNVLGIAVAEGKLWPDLPRDGFHSWGAGGHYAAVFPSLELVIVQIPDPFGVRGGEGANPELMDLVFAAMR